MKSRRSRKPNLSEALEIDGLCDRFEAELAAADPADTGPLIERFLPEGEIRREALRELLGLELYFRRERGLALPREELMARFAADGDVVEEALAEIGTDTAGAEAGRGIAAALRASGFFGDTAGEGEGRTVGGGHLCIEGYEVKAVLGRGGMGVVYLARHLGLKIDVAIKVLLAGEHAGPDDIDRFRTEAEAVARVSHEGVLRVFDYGTTRTASGQPVPYLVVEFCPGGNLADRLAGGPQQPDECVRIVSSLASAVQAAHDKDVVHRDLKPANVLIGENGTLKIADFGLAKVGGNTRLTGTGARLGTPLYMAPEQATGNAADAGPACDVHALGLILYECLTGRTPYHAATTATVMQLIAGSPPVPPSRRIPSVPRDLETICLKCLEKDPARRYASAGALLADLTAFAEEKPIAARPAGAAERAWRWVRRNRAVAALRAMTAVVGVLLAVQLLGLTQEIPMGQAKVDTEPELDPKVVEAKWLHTEDSARLVSFSADGKQLAAVLDTARGCVVSVWSLDTGRHLHATRATTSIWRTLSADLRCGAYASNGKIVVEDLRKGVEIGRMGVDSGQFVTAVLSPDGKSFLGRNGSGIHACDIEPGEKRWTVRGMSSMTGAYIWSRDGNTVYLVRRAVKGAVIEERSGATGEKRGLAIVVPFFLNQLATGIGSILAGTNTQGNVAILDPTAGKVVIAYKLSDHPCFPAVSADDRLIAFVGKGGGMLYDRTGREMAKFGADASDWVSVAFSPDGSLLATGGKATEGKSSVRLWRVLAPPGGKNPEK